MGKFCFVFGDFDMHARGRKGGGSRKVMLVTLDAQKFCHRTLGFGFLTI